MPRDLILLFIIPILLVVICLATGYSILNILKKRYNFYLMFIAGYIFSTALFQVMAMPFMLFSLNFSLLFYMYIGTIIVVCLYALYIFNRSGKGLGEIIRRIVSIFFVNKVKNIAWYLICLGIAGQVLYVVAKQHTDIDDSFYIAIVNTIIDTDTVHNIDPASGLVQFGFSPQYKLVGYEVLLSVIVRFFGVNAAYFAHTILPVFLIPFHYFIVIAIAKQINERRAPYFVFLYEVVNVYSGYSGYSQGAFLLYRIWQGKAVMINIIIPILILVFLWLYNSNKKIGIFEIICVTGVLISGLHTTTVAIYLVPIAYFALVISYFFIFRNWINVIKLCIPVVFLLPFVALKLLVLYLDSAQSSIGTIESVTADVENLSYTYELIDKVMSKNVVLLLLVAIALVYLLIKGRENVKGVFVLPAIILMVTFCNPFFMRIIAQNVTGTDVYWRLFWLLEFPFILVTAIALLIDNLRLNDIYGIMPAVGAVVIALNGSYIFTDEGFVDRENRYKLDGRSVAISDMVLADCQEICFDNEIVLLLPVDISYSIREYTGEISLLINRYTSEESYQNIGKGEDYKRLNDLSQMLWVEQKWDNKCLEEEMDYFNVDYLVVYAQSLEKNILPDNLIKIGACNEFILYRVNNL